MPLMYMDIYVCISQLGCLYNVVKDMEERHEVSSQYPAVAKQMLDELNQAAKTIWATDHSNDPACRAAAHSRYGGFYGPWKEI